MYVCIYLCMYVFHGGVLRKYLHACMRARVCFGRFTHVFDNHDEEGKLDPKSFVLVLWARDVIGADICAHDFQD